MARTPNVKIQSWGTPPAPQPTGWDAVRAELDKKPGQWANVGEMTPATARRVTAERLTIAEGYESQTSPGSDDRKIVLWLRKTDAPAPAEKADAPAPTKAGK